MRDFGIREAPEQGHKKCHATGAAETPATTADVADRSVSWASYQRLEEDVGAQKLPAVAAGASPVLFLLLWGRETIR